jgi:hypothetical protein
MANIPQPIDRSSISAFEAIVNKDVKGQVSDQEIDTLMYNLDLWLYCLQCIKKDVEYHLSSHNANRKLIIQEMRDKQSSKEEIYKYISNESKWRVNTLRFLASLERKVLYVKLLVRQKALTEAKSG